MLGPAGLQVHTGVLLDRFSQPGGEVIVGDVSPVATDADDDAVLAGHLGSGVLDDLAEGGGRLGGLDSAVVQIDFHRVLRVRYRLCYRQLVTTGIKCINPR